MELEVPRSSGIAGAARSPFERWASRSAAIDILRVVAVLLVMGRHMHPCPRSVNAPLWAATALWHRGGWVGVDLFFVLSGFLVSGLLFRELSMTGDVAYGRFLARRALKLYPAFWVLTAVTVLMRWHDSFEVPVAHVLAELTFTQNYFQGLWNHTWSLAVEEHFYLLLCALVAFAARRRAPGERFVPGLPAWFAAVALSCLAIRIATAIAIPQFDFRWHFAATHARIDSLMFGVLIAWLWHFRDLSRRLEGRGVALALVGVALLSPAFIFPIDDVTVTVFGATSHYLGAGCILCSALGSSALTRAWLRPVARIGQYSYSIYLWHMPVHEWCRAYVRPLVESEGLGWSLYAAAYLLGSVALGVATAVAIEVPVLRLRDRLLPSPVTSIRP